MQHAQYALVWRFEWRLGKHGGKRTARPVDGTCCGGVLYDDGLSDTAQCRSLKRKGDLSGVMKLLRGLTLTVVAARDAICLTTAALWSGFITLTIVSDIPGRAKSAAYLDPTTCCSQYIGLPVESLASFTAYRILQLPQPLRLLV